MESRDCPYVSRGGLKLEHALRTFGVDVQGLVCADLGASTGGFTDCLLKHGAARVYAVDTAYGELAWSLRKDPRVVVMERANALHTEPPADVAARGGVDLCVLDLGWTKQERAIPAALRWIGTSGRIISLVKPHYEAERSGGRVRGQKGGGAVVLDDAEAEEIARRVIEGLPSLGVRVLGSCASPIRGGASKGKKREGTGNLEWLVALERER